MQTRWLVFFVYALNFIVNFFVILYVLRNFWNLLEAWETALYFYYLLIGVCGVALAYWLAKDEEEISYLKKQMRELKETS